MSKNNSLNSGKTLRSEKITRHQQIQENLGLREVNIGHEIRNLMAVLKELELEYEQYFMGINKIPPTLLHNRFKRQLARVTGLPFKKAAEGFRVKAIEQRYQVLHSYWQRVVIAKENGTYKKDLFLLQLREKNEQEDQKSLTKEGKQHKQIEDLYSVYKRELEKVTGKVCNLDIAKFEKSIRERAKLFKEKNPDKKIKFKIVIKDNQVVIRGEAK